MEKKVLFIASDYLPNKNGGTIRLEKLIKYFPENLIASVVLTRRNEFNRGPEEVSGSKVYRTRNLDLFNWGLKRILYFKSFFARHKEAGASGCVKSKNSNSRFADNWIVPDTDIFWALGSVFKAIKIIKKDGIEIIYTSSPSSSVHVLGLLLKLIMPRLKWIAEYRDPWTFNPFRYPKPYFLEKIDHFLEEACTKRADQIIVVSNHFKDVFLSKYPFLQSQQIEVIPNGYDLADFSSLSQKVKPTGQNYITLLHAGNFYEKRSLLPIVKALQEMEQEDPSISKKIKVIQYGNIDPQTESFLNSTPINSLLLMNKVSHQESLEAMFKADWLLLIPGPGKGTMTGKVFEYLVAQRPILILAEEGPAKDIVVDNNIGLCVSTADHKRIKEILLNLSVGLDFPMKTDLDSSNLRIYDRRVIAQRTANILQKF